MHTTIKIEFDENNLSKKQQKCLDDRIKLVNPFGGFDPCEGDNYFWVYMQNEYSSEEIAIADAIIKKIKTLIRDEGTKAVYKYLKTVCPLYNQ